jgi:hypothetical protein
VFDRVLRIVLALLSTVTFDGTFFVFVLFFSIRRSLPRGDENIRRVQAVSIDLFSDGIDHEKTNDRAKSDRNT